MTVNVVVVKVPVKLPQLSGLSLPLLRLQAEENKLITVKNTKKMMIIAHLRKDSNEASGAWRNL